VLVGLRGLWLRRKDDQKLAQNNINLRIGAFSANPWAGLHAGLRLDF
jgi:hypothetical protein